MTPKSKLSQYITECYLERLRELRNAANAPEAMPQDAAVLAALQKHREGTDTAPREHSDNPIVAALERGQRAVTPRITDC